jgi:hypothetical protein
MFTTQNPNYRNCRNGFRRTEFLKRIEDMNSRPTVKTSNAATSPAKPPTGVLNLGVATGVACTVPKRFYGVLND